jgi:hypothetical protein
MRIVALGSFDLDGTPVPPQGVISTSEHWQFRVLRENVCSAEQSKTVVDLWNLLPEGSVARCHVPGFGIQLMLQGEVIFIAALCWQCNNISIGGKLADTGWRAFDAASDSAIQLLNICEQVAGRAA